MMFAIAAIYVGEKYLEAKENKALVEDGKILKAENLSYFLPSGESSTIVHHKYYSLSYNENAEQALWVAYTLNRNQLEGVNVSRPYFDIDLAVETGAADWRNYKNSGYDRGHLCPAGDRKFSSQAYTETFLTSNITPQLHNFNSGVWNRLENQVRDWARRYDEITVVTAGVLTKPLGTIGSEHVSVPREFYKIVLRKNEAGYTCIGFLIPHKESSEDLKNFVVPVDEIELATGIDFFQKLDDSEESKMEKVTNLNSWVF